MRMSGLLKKWCIGPGFVCLWLCRSITGQGIRDWGSNAVMDLISWVLVTSQYESIYVFALHYLFSSLVSLYCMADLSQKRVYTIPLVSFWSISDSSPCQESMNESVGEAVDFSGVVVSKTEPPSKDPYLLIPRIYEYYLRWQMYLSEGSWDLSTQDEKAMWRWSGETFEDTNPGDWSDVAIVKECWQLPETGKGKQILP